jgi:putative phosphonate catabolism associated alcohol dehydrogenase
MDNKKSNIALFLGTAGEIKLTQTQIPELEPGEILVRITCATICGSDLHTFRGKRKVKLPTILGHEMVGVVEKINNLEVTKDYWEQDVTVGSRITWSLICSCGSCPRCLSGFSQKCSNLFKYGHEKFAKLCPLSGGFAEYCIIKKNTPIYIVPNFISDHIAAPANCSLATAAACVRQVNDWQGKSVLIQGGGLLGLMVCALSRSKLVKNSKVVLVDSKTERLELAREFGADEVFCVSDKDSNSKFSDSCQEKGFDIVFECSGSSSSMIDGIKKINIGGLYILAGAVFPVNEKCLDPEQIIRKMLTIKGVHNYKAEDLAVALKFLESSYESFPYHKIVSKTFSLAQLGEAFVQAEKADSLRTAIVN